MYSTPHGCWGSLYTCFTDGTLRRVRTNFCLCRTFGRTRPRWIARGGSCSTPSDNSRTCSFCFSLRSGSRNGSSYCTTFSGGSLSCWQKSRFSVGSGSSRGTTTVLTPHRRLSTLVCCGISRSSWFRGTRNPSSLTVLQSTVSILLWYLSAFSVSATRSFSTGCTRWRGF